MQLLFGPVPQIDALGVLLLLVGIGVLLVVPGLMGKVLYDRLRGIGPPAVSDAQDTPVSDKWWWLVAIQPAWFLLVLTVFLIETSIDAHLFRGVVYPIQLVGFVTLPLAPIGVHYDRKYVAAVADWRPSIAYYLTFASLVGVLLAAIYVYERHQHVGVP